MEPAKLPEPLIAAAQIAQRIAELGERISLDYRDKELVLLCVLKGSFVFAADLARAITLPLEVEFLGVKSYGDDTISSGVVQITQDLTRSVEGKHVLLVEDIVDTGLTLSFLVGHLAARRPASVKVAALLHKPQSTKGDLPLEYVGFTVGDEFVVGYGLDHAQRHRNLPYVGKL
jgi:hypoxanthine phosphoribosyltransferase